MGRPLKIAKAQAVLTLTAINGTTEVVTVSQTLATAGVTAGMPFTVATTTGGLVAGTTYWILAVTGASTFTVSATDLSANPTFVKANLTTAGPVTVALTVGAVDTGFNVPNGAANTYGVVGGNTSIYGKQVLTRVAIGISSAGVINSSSASADVYGGGTDFANTLVAGTAIQAVSSTGEAVNLGFATGAGAYVTVEIAGTNAVTNIIDTTGNALTLTVGQPVTFSSSLGGLVAGTVYYVQTTPDDATMTVKTGPLGQTVKLTTATGAPDAIQDVVTLAANAAATITNSSWVRADDEAGFIVRQKGKTKYLVTGTTTGLTAPCYTANVANTALTPNTMNILATYANAATAYTQSVSDYNSKLFGAVPVVATFNTAYAANTYGGQPYPIVTISNA